MFVKILGGIDFAAAIVFLMLVFGMAPIFQIVIFCAGLLFIKGLFALTGDILSFVDLFAAIILVFSLFFMPPTILLWVPAFLLLSKAVVSFI